MKTIAWITMLGWLLIGCTEKRHDPIGRWEATARINVYKNNDHPLITSFIIEKGEVCAISEEVLIRKDLGYSKISCDKGQGWVTSGEFKKLSD